MKLLEKNDWLISRFFSRHFYRLPLAGISDGIEGSVGIVDWVGTLGLDGVCITADGPTLFVLKITRRKGFLKIQHNISLLLH